MMNALSLGFAEPNDREWQAFVAKQDNLNVFHHPCWTRLLEASYGYRSLVITLYNPDGSICAGLPVMESNPLLFGHRWISLPFSDHCTPIAADSQALHYLASSLRAFSGEPDAPRIEIRWELPGSVAPRTTPCYFLHQLQLHSDVDRVCRRIHHGHLRNVRMAQAHGVEIRRGTEQQDLDAFYRLHLQSRRRQGIPIQPRRYFQLLNELVLRKGLGFISLAYHGTECLAGAVFLHWKGTLTYKYGACNLDGLCLRPNNLIFWDAIQWACDNGFSILDFGRSDVENQGLRVFKSRWGANEIPLNYSYFPTITDHPGKARRLLPAIHTLIRRSPLWVCRLGGEIGYRYFA